MHDCFHTPITKKRFNFLNITQIKTSKMLYSEKNVDKLHTTLTPIKQYKNLRCQYYICTPYVMLLIIASNLYQTSTVKYVY